MTMGTHEPNLFEDATYELSHSAFLAWLFKKAKRAPASVFGDFASHLFRAGTDEPSPSFRVKAVHREHPLPVGGQIDLLLHGRTDSKSVIWGIETKRGSQASEEQLSRYSKGLSQYAVDHESGDSKCYLTLYSTRHIVRGFNPTDRPRSILRDDVIEVLQDLLPDNCRGDLWLLEHYLAWLVKQADLYQPWADPGSWSSYVAGDDAVTSPRISEIVQYCFMSETVAEPLSEHFSWGTSSGRPWTQVEITRDDSKAREQEARIAKTAGRLLYRMDNRRKNHEPYPYLELRQYTLEPDRNELIKEKKGIAEALRTLFTEAVAQVLESATPAPMDLAADDSSYVSPCPYSRVKDRETALSGFHFFEGRHPDLSELCNLFPAIHSQFTQMLESDRVNEFSVSDELSYLGERVVRI